MTDEHLTAVDNVARDIYNYAAGRITAFLQETYSQSAEGAVSEQFNDFHLIAERACVYIMGNYLAVSDTSAEEDSIKMLNKHLRSMANTIRQMAPDPNGMLN